MLSLRGMKFKVCWANKETVLLITFWRFMYNIFKNKKSKRSHKAVGIKVFLTFFAWWYKDPDPDPGGPKTCGSGGSGSDFGSGGSGSDFGSGSATLVYRVRLFTVLYYDDVSTLGWRSLVKVFEKLKLRQLRQKKRMVTSSGKPCVRPLKKLPY
jgi:hypothetical protein